MQQRNNPLSTRAGERHASCTVDVVLRVEISVKWGMADADAGFALRIVRYGLFMSISGQVCGCSGSELRIASSDGFECELMAVETEETGEGENGPLGVGGRR
jgi:hypothetical protein